MSYFCPCFFRFSNEKPSLFKFKPETVKCTDRKKDYCKCIQTKENKATIECDERNSNRRNVEEGATKIDSSKSK